MLKPIDSTSLPRINADIDLKNDSHHNEVYREVLLALAKATHFSLRAHVPRHAVLSKCALKDRGKTKKDLKRIVRMGFATRHPTSGEMTFHLTRLGLTLVRKLEE